jgi:hypothetical protein
MSALRVEAVEHAEKFERVRGRERDRYAARSAGDYIIVEKERARNSTKSASEPPTPSQYT